MIKLVSTSDGSNSFFNESIGEQYHSKHGAVQESKHVFINAGLSFVAEQSKDIALFEMGFGTGLNFLFSLEYALRHKISLNYTAIEAFPLSIDLINLANYKSYVNTEVWQVFEDLYARALNDGRAENQNITLKLIQGKLQDFRAESAYDLVYYDAFSVQHQPELWTDEMIAHTASMLKPSGVFVTYAITGKLKRALKACACNIEKLPGAPGKREMLRAIKF